MLAGEPGQLFGVRVGAPPSGNHRPPSSSQENTTISAITERQGH
jgi:hypothetical protein